MRPFDGTSYNLSANDVSNNFKDESRISVGLLKDVMIDFRDARAYTFIPSHESSFTPTD